MRITKIEEQKKDFNRVSVYLEEKFWMGMSKDMLIYFNLYVDKDLTRDDIKTIEEKGKEQKVLNTAIAYISYQPRTEWEVRKKLNSKEYEGQVIDLIINKLKGEGYINDDYYVNEYIESRIAYDGPYKIGMKLENKGIEKTLIQAVLLNYDESVLISYAVKNGEKKNNGFSTSLSRQKRYAKLSQFLVGRGYNYSIVKKAVEKILEDVPFDDYKNQYNYDDEDYETQFDDLKKLLLKKYKSIDDKYDKRKKKEKTIRYLMGKGYPYETIKKCFEFVEENDAELIE